MIEIKNLSYSYTDSKPILDRLNLSVKESEIILINGKSGCGKSTLLNLIYGILDCTNKNSSIIYNNKEVHNLSIEERAKKFAYVFQDIDLQLCTHTVKSEVRFGLENQGLTHSEIESISDEFLNLAGLKYRQNQTVSSLSGGQKQKLIISSILALKTKVVLMDEPLAQLDVLSAKEIIEFIQTISEKYGICFIICEHRSHFFEDEKIKKFTLEDGCLKPFEPYPESYLEKSPQNPMPLETNLSLKNVSISLRNNYRIIENISVGFTKGERVALLGNNGSGKTTLFQAIAGLVKHKGEIIYQGKLALLFQNPDLMLTKFSVKDEIPEKELRVKLDLEEEKDQHPLTLSKGQRLRCAFGQIMSRQPDILIMDEPTSGQDIAHINQIISLINDFPEMTVICSSHDIDFILSFAKRVIILKNGNIILDEENHFKKQNLLDLLNSY